MLGPGQERIESKKDKEGDTGEQDDPFRRRRGPLEWLPFLDLLEAVNQRNEQDSTQRAVVTRVDSGGEHPEEEIGDGQNECLPGQKQEDNAQPQKGEGIPIGFPREEMDVRKEFMIAYMFVGGSRCPRDIDINGDQ
jgi:hypothetical protein